VAQDQKGAAERHAWLAFLDESGVSLLPVTRRTWSPKGTTPILRHRCNWRRASMAAALGYHASDAERGPRLCFHVQQGSYDTASLIEVLTQLKAFYVGEQVVLLWDGLGAHWSHDMCAWLEGQQGWLAVERMPAYAPELNPVEFLWANLKGWSWPTSPVTSSSRSSTPPSGASGGSATTSSWRGRSWRIPASPSTTSSHPTSENLNRSAQVLQ
jgi:transposase